MHDLFGSLTVISDDNDVWFIGREVADKLGYKDTGKAIRMHCKYLKILKQDIAESLKFPFEVPPRGIQIINEKDLYRLIMRSHLPSAVDFQDWVTDEVLPTIRKTGSYSFTKKTYSEHLRQLADEIEKNEILEEKIKEDRPLVEFAEQVTKSNDAIDFETFAKLVKDQFIPIGRNRLYKWMRTQKYIMDNNLPYQHIIERQFLIVVETTYHTSFGIRLSKRIMITPLGQVWFCNKLKAEFK